MKTQMDRPNGHVTWRELIISAMDLHGETWLDVVHCTLADADLDVEFYCGLGDTEGKPFTLWTANRVYFPSCYDGAEAAASVPRSPADPFSASEATHHVGGG